MRRSLARGLVAVLALGGTARAQEVVCPFPGQKPVVVVQLYLGQDMGGGRTVQPGEWRAFVAGSLTQAFPGFTIYDAAGQWVDPATQRISHDRTKVVEIILTDLAPYRDSIERALATYQRRFRQKSVGLLTSTRCARF